MMALQNRFASDAALRIAVIDTPDDAVYERLSDCPFEVMVRAPTPERFDARREVLDAILVACDEDDLGDRSFQVAVARFSSAHPALAVMAGVGSSVAAARLGFHGLVRRDVSPEALTRTVRVIARGELAFPRAAQAEVFALLGLPARPAAQGSRPPLTPRQQEIVDLIAEGSTDRQIASQLRISESTAHKHVQNALRRSKARTRSQLVAVMRGLLPAR